MAELKGQFGIIGMEDDGAAEYQAFTDKFKPKLTTDDCYTPDDIYAAVLDFASRHYGFDPEQAVRPFWPGGDYQGFDYSPQCVVVDNPPFSILTEIQRFYQSRNIKFFLFAPGLSVITSDVGVTAIVTNIKITYKNGASVPTAFRTNLSPEIAVQTLPELDLAIQRIQAEAKTANQLPKYEYPANLVHIAPLKRIATGHIPYALPWREVRFVRSLDAQRKLDKAIFGGGFLVSDRAAAERAAAERAAADRAAAERAAAERNPAIVFELSTREREIVAALEKEARP